jgi:hypothetical protein
LKPFVSLAVLAFAVATSASVSAADATKNREVPGDRIATFRGDFNKMLDSYDAIFHRLGNTRGLRTVADARESLRVVTDEQLARVFERMHIPDLSGAVQAAAVLESHTPRTASPVNLTPGFPNAPSILSECDDIEHDSGFTFGALVAFQVLRTVLAAAEFACLEVVVILGEGGNGSAVCIPFAIAQDVAAIPYELADFCGGEEDSAIAQGSYDRLEHVHNDLDAARTAILSSIDTHTTQIINNDNANRVTIVNNDNANRVLIINNDNTNRDIILADALANRDFLVAELRRVACDMLRLENTPDGQRASSNPSCVGQPQFPYNFPEHP